MEIKDQSGEGAAKQEATGEEYKQEAEQFLKLHGKDKVFTPSAFRGVFNAYLLFIGTVTGVGMLASYSHHETTANVFLLVVIPLLVIALIGAFWYLIATFGKKSSEKIAPKMKGLAEKIVRSRAGMTLIRFTSNRFAKLLLYALYIATIGLHISNFPRVPRFSLTFMSFSILVLISMAAFDVAAVRKKEHEKDTMMLANAVVSLYEKMKIHEIEITYAKNIAEIANKCLTDTAPLEKELYKRIITAIEKTGESVQELDSKTTRLAAKLPDTEPEQLDASSVDDEETGDG